jgi:hypothetical protein
LRFHYVKTYAQHTTTSSVRSTMTWEVRSAHRAYEHTLNSSTVPAGSPALEIRDIELRFGGVVALHDVGFTVTQGTSTRSSAQRCRQVESAQLRERALPPAAGLGTSCTPAMARTTHS